MTEPDYDYSDTYDETDDSQDESPSITLKRSQIKALQRDAKEARKLREEMTGIRREQALASVGKDLNEFQQDSLLSAMEKHSLDARTAAERLGYIQPDTSAADEAAALDRMSEASNGSSVDPADEDPVARLNRAYAEGGPEGLKAQIERDGNRITVYE